MNNSKATIVVSQIIEKIQMFFGVICAIFGTLGFLVSLDNMNADKFGVSIFFVGVGALLIYFGRKRKKLLMDFKTYVTRLSVNSTGSVEYLASSLNRSPNIIKKNLQLMINKKYFVDAYLDEHNNCIVFPNRQQKNVDSQDQVKYANHFKIEYVAARCKSCGAINKIECGVVTECEFCGTPLKG